MKLIGIGRSGNDVSIEVKPYKVEKLTRNKHGELEGTFLSKSGAMYFVRSGRAVRAPKAVFVASPAYIEE